MAELEVHTEVEGADPFGKKIGILASVLAVLLGVVTIVSHRAHTDAVLIKSDANDKWSFYQAKRIKFHSLELGDDLLNVLGDKGPEAQKSSKIARREERSSTRVRRGAGRRAKDRTRRRATWRTGRCASISAKVCLRSGSCLRRFISFRGRSCSR